MGIALSTTVDTSFEDAVTRTREALAHKGFGVLSEIDVKATLKAKLGQDMEDYLILGACNPQFAHQAVNLYRQIGVLLPCNVVVRRDRDAPEKVIIDAMDPRLMADVTQEPGLGAIADAVTGLLQEALQEVSRGPQGAEGNT
ncbi:DUF302 domain-containing protein [Mycobacterium xenopi]|uniref:ABC transporter n=2 Tax=Mycobacterium xenopi TaxID=1789 RepID=A0AAD1H2F7_MYCXE|nr:DUF302 domain-containing protein [Mycobacterium xenopi]EUA13906.1 hypothetical protein I553_7026 [Mycobacterium xenopi 4042]EUA33855.1 hypothetical protein I552_4636 [Mycobacterium xenopi 3993]EID11285.1 hypothetical protein MXEN_16652 [Mycobacterium xenopi RIVM700367]MDA3641354.1 DUF302 domain-containing protein [Mycobacterium xenopi]MDA3659301.1 DUF302 domain-containing protein [Mycobacterium xenopi]